MARARYIDDPMTANVPLDLDEAEALAAAPPRDLRDPNKLSHLLNRVVLALVADTEQITRLHTQMAQIQAESRAVGAAPTLDPSTMLRYVSDEEIAAAAEAGLRRRIQAVLRDERTVEAALRSLRSREAAVRFVVTAALADEDLDDSTRTKLQAALEAVEAPAPDLREAKHAADNVNAMAAALGIEPNRAVEEPTPDSNPSLDGAGHGFAPVDDVTQADPHGTDPDAEAPADEDELAGLFE